jgi:dTDP-4-amino-4,6-dideoxygalactose transaminase
MAQFQAAILSCQLTRLDAQNMLRAENANYLRSLLRDIDGIASLEVASYVTQHAYHLYIIKYDKSKFKNLSKAEFTDLLNSEGVPCFMGYPEPLYKQPVFQNKEFMCYTIPESVDYKGVHCPETEKACYEECMWLNQSVLLGTREDMKLIAKAIKKIQENIKPVEQGV